MPKKIKSFILVDNPKNLDGKFSIEMKLTLSTYLGSNEPILILEIPFEKFKIMQGKRLHIVMAVKNK